MKWAGLSGPITAAAAEAERDRLFDRPARPLSTELARLFASAERMAKCSATTANSG
jgi:hypothetical protein